ncbi:hypothetical protein CDAR_174951 [Caerostris darwini]|uniref:Centromere/kinetochore protein zw10 homolog n=1 Tax=Caerostris darwini TaxID=1538125 RepID=A0AAV4T0H4_9ARAC|nr:hypothetical protein CDAR_174951 [Caerostris darwini]
MSSIVAEVLQNTKKLVKENIEVKVGSLKRNLDDIKLEVHENLKSQNVEFFPQYVKLEKLLDDINDLNYEYDNLNNQIEKEIKPQMVTSVVEFGDVVEDLKRIKKLITVVQSLSLLHQHLEKAKSAFSQSSYLISVDSLLQFQKVLKDIGPEKEKNIAIISALKTEFVVTRENIIYHLENLFREKIVIISSLTEKKSLSIQISKSIGSEDEGEILIALKLLKQLRPLLKEFGKQFLNLVCDTILTNITNIIYPKESSAMDIQIIKDHNPEPNEAFEALKTIFAFLQKEFFHLSITAKGEEVQSLMSEFGSVIGEDFCTLVIERCLKIAIPKKSKQLETFHKKIFTAEEFCKFLQDMEFISSSGSKLLNFIHEVDILPVNKMAQEFMSRARFLMQKSLHQIVGVGTESPINSNSSNAPDLNEMTRTQNGLSAATFLFSRCQISESIKELIHLLLEIKEEAKNIGPAHAPRLYYVARNVCELYCCVVFTYHKREIEKIPQQTAIYHNNCMYLAHQLCKISSLYQSDLQPEIPMTFADLIPEIRKLGTEAFLTQMRNQKHQILQLLQEQQEYSSLLVDDGTVNKAEKAIRQCLCQLQLLKKVWADILPLEVYFKAIGTLFNTCLEEIILRICSMEDIAADAAAQLDCIFAILLKQGPDLFKVPVIDKSDSVHFYVKRWFKFQELQLILSASMREIVDRWANGKGPLAAHFTSAEVKHLIRALFQNTERRAAALAKIR